jgi:hypothetical protein
VGAGAGDRVDAFAMKHPTRWAFAFLFLGMALAVFILAQANTRFDRADRRFDRIAAESCSNRLKQYDTTLVLINIQTTHVPVPDVLTGVPSEVERYRLANERRDTNRVRLLEALGERPKCSVRP